MIAEKTKEVLQKIKDEINNEYGFHDEIPRINYGPCGVFAQIFFKKWNELFKEKVHICFILTQSKDECDHVLIRLPSGELYDSGIGVHSDKQYKTKFKTIIKDRKCKIQSVMDPRLTKHLKSGMDKARLPLQKAPNILPLP